LAKRHTPEEIADKLRRASVLMSRGAAAVDAIRGIGVSDGTYYRWRRNFKGLKSPPLHKLEDLEAENARLRRALSDVALDRLIAAEVDQAIF
jgi:putative transposase